MDLIFVMHTDFACVENATFLYKVPFRRQEEGFRQKALDDALLIARKKYKGYSCLVTYSAYEMAMMVHSLL